jgi:hypothetical protein
MKNYLLLKGQVADSEVRFSGHSMTGDPVSCEKDTGTPSFRPITVRTHCYFS